ncbi:mitochondrial fission ELM1 family protein [Reyranella sp. CPCC 100927]|uniref:mitochondrial fission ELM1 family protein n=1 Tax=Reyranella sp. CPCC 100927 TaxID=2599616 RepID=UPI0011B3B1D4|nr:ELM1/GtrOC1 family putative glycosyltransferase [Reyranella sp. CPCC 100927]TWT01232.1 nucleoside-diphosphate sugar epimerase [Reyranella sp. CPCC 100927]
METGTRVRYNIVMHDVRRSAPLVWLLVGDKGGDTAQLRRLARALAWPTVEKPLKFNGLYRLPNRVLGASVVSLAAPATADLAPPWPDLVLSSGRRTAPVARWIRDRSGGRAKLVNVGRPWGPLAAFDLVVAMPQYQLPSGANVWPARLPFNRIDPAAMAEGAAGWTSRLGDLKPPFLAVLVGGSARPLRFDAAAGHAIGRNVDVLARGMNGAVLVVTSRRTPEAVIAALEAEITVPRLVHRWRAGDASNALAGVVGLADRVVVTGDSASMIAEACHSGKPVSVAPVPLDRSWREQLPRMVWRLLPRPVVDALYAGGWITLPRDMAALWQSLARDHHVHILGEPMAATTAPPDDLPAVAARIRALLS